MERTLLSLFREAHNLICGEEYEDALGLLRNFLCNSLADVNLDDYNRMRMPVIDSIEENLSKHFNDEIKAKWEKLKRPVSVMHGSIYDTTHMLKIHDAVLLYNFPFTVVGECHNKSEH